MSLLTAITILSMLAMIVGIAVIMFLLVVNFGKNGHLEDDHTDDDRSLM